jgi:uncharacterized protein
VESEWDPEKAASNFKKHRIRFTEAVTIFRDDWLLTILDEISDEERYLTVGRGSLGEILAVVYTVRGENVGIITARKATRRQCREYENRK